MEINDDVLSRDTYAGSMAILAALFLIAYLLINPPAKQDDEPPPGSLSIYAAWPEGPIDIDVWSLAPGEPNPVGFTNKTGQLLSLLRDDVGTSNDVMPANFENVYSRGIPAGEYTVNLHCWNCPTLPVEVMVEVRVARPGADSVRVFSAKVTLRGQRQEVTAVRFRLDGDGKLVRNSLHNVFQPLYGAPRP